jgi:transcriptional regulator with XRE-family HTH domain
MHTDDGREIGRQARRAFAERLCQALLARGYRSQRFAKPPVDAPALAIALDVTVGMARRYCRGQALPHRSTLERVAAWLHVSFPWLREGTGHMDAGMAPKLSSEEALRPIPLPAERFDAELARLGWPRSLVARRWGISPARLRRLISNPKRPAFWDDALRALPTCPPEARRTRRPPRRRRAPGGPQRAKQIKFGPGYRYSGFLVVGRIVVTNQPLGVGPEGVAGVVQAVINAGTEERYRVRFAGGQQDVFGPDDVDRLLVDTAKMTPPEVLGSSVNDHDPA